MRSRDCISPKGKCTAWLVVLALLAMSCTAPASPTASPQIRATSLPTVQVVQPTISGAPPLHDSGLVPQIASLEALDSYRLRTATRIQKPDGSWTPDQKMEVERVKEPPASHTTIYDLAGNVSLETIAIGDTVWVKMDNYWMRAQSGSGSQGQTLIDQDRILRDLRGDMKLQNEETVNSIRCKRYSIEAQTTLDVPDIATGATRKAMAHVQGEVWIADQSGLPPISVRSKIQMGWEASEKTPIVMYNEVEIYDLNAPLTISPPA